MLYEFALDPTVLSNWQSVRFFLDRFGIEYGRMISRFPKHWMRMVYEASANCREVELSRIVERLAELKQNRDRVLLNSARIYDPTIEWLENAEAANAISPFHAIISRCNPRGCPSVLISDDIYDATPLFHVERELYITSRAAVMAPAVSPLLLASKEILCVDRHFDPLQEKYQRPLREFVRAAVSTETTRIEYHLRGDLPSSLYAEEFSQYCHEALPGILPSGVELRLIRWGQRVGGREFHARFILTDVGGIQFDPGLDEGKAGERTKLNLLTTAAYDQEWSKYQNDGIHPAATTFSLLDEVLVIGEA